jgi:hypothetical protein
MIRFAVKPQIMSNLIKICEYPNLTALTLPFIVFFEINDTDFYLTPFNGFTRNLNTLLTLLSFFIPAARAQKTDKCFPSLFS